MGTYTEVIIVASICAIVSLISVLLRIWTRITYLSHGLGSDDWTMIASLVPYLLLCCTALYLAEFERRNPLITVPIANELLLIFVAAEVIFMATTILVKTSLTIFFLQFMRGAWQRRITIISGTVCCTVSFCALFACIFQCGLPVNMAVKTLDGQCIPTNIFEGLLYAHGAICVVSDWTFAFLPIVTLMRSQLPKATKYSASALMTLAIAASTAAIARTAYSDSVRFRAAYYSSDHQPTYYRATFTAVELALVELGCGIAASSLACLRPLLHRCADGWSNVKEKVSHSTSKNLDDVESGNNECAIRVGSVEKLAQHVTVTQPIPKPKSTMVRQYSLAIQQIDMMSESDELTPVGTAITTDEPVILEHMV